MLNKKQLELLGYEINPDPDQPGMFYWRNINEGSDVSFDSEAGAIAAAGKDAIETYALHSCDNCGKVHSDETLREVKHMSMRTEPGGIIPSGECVDCGALCYPFKAEEDAGKEEMKVLTEPMTIDQIEAICTKDANMAVVFAATLDELIGTGDIEMMNELAERKIVHAEVPGCLSDICYQVVGHVGESSSGYIAGSVLIRVNAQFTFY